MKKYIIFLTITIITSSCATVIPMFIGKRTAKPSNSELAKKADQYFWENLHQGNYDSIPQMLFYLNAAYIENPRDASLAFHLGHTHLWKVAEMHRKEEVTPDAVEHIMLAKKYFNDAYELSDDPRALGFLADMYMAQGSIDKDTKMIVKGFMLGKKSIKEWPQFNLFTIGYVMANFDHTNKRYQQAVEMQWETLDKCLGEKIDRSNPNLEKYVYQITEVTEEKIRRTCWNSWIAPHNFEGFCLNFGDMLVKSGDWQTAIVMYNNAKVVPEYKDWAFQDLLENRIENAERNVKIFREASGNQKQLEGVMMSASKINCMACHQKSIYKTPKESDEYLPNFMKERYLR